MLSGSLQGIAHLQHQRDLSGPSITLGELAEMGASIGDAPLMRAAIEGNYAVQEVHDSIGRGQMAQVLHLSLLHPFLPCLGELL